MAREKLIKKIQKNLNNRGLLGFIQLLFILFFLVSNQIIDFCYNLNLSKTWVFLHYLWHCIPFFLLKIFEQEAFMVLQVFSLINLFIILFFIQTESRLNLIFASVKTDQDIKKIENQFFFYFARIPKIANGFVHRTGGIRTLLGVGMRSLEKTSNATILTCSVSLGIAGFSTWYANNNNPQLATLQENNRHIEAMAKISADVKIAEINSRHRRFF